MLIEDNRSVMYLCTLTDSPWSVTKLWEAPGCPMQVPITTNPSSSSSVSVPLISGPLFPRLLVKSYPQMSLSDSVTLLRLLYSNLS